jgi:hypothetical protein
MKTNSQIDIKGNVEIQLFDENGNLKDYRKIKNTVVTAGKNFIADQLSDSPGATKMTHMAVGTGTTAVDAGDTALQTQTDRNALTSNTDSGNVVTFVGDWAAGDATAAITEAGIFNAASNGTMLARTVFSAINKAAADTLKITWTLTIG